MMVKTLYIIEDCARVIIPKRLRGNQKLIRHVDGAFIVTEEKNNKRCFGGAYVKLGVREDNNERTWISSTISERTLKNVMISFYHIDKNKIIRI